MFSNDYGPWELFDKLKLSLCIFFMAKHLTLHNWFDVNSKMIHANILQQPEKIFFYHFFSEFLEHFFLNSTFFSIICNFIFS